MHPQRRGWNAVDPYVLGIYTEWFFAAEEVCGTLMIDREI